MIESGVFPKEELEKLAARIVLFVCTGNTCRSPLAEALAKKLLADRLGCRPASCRPAGSGCCRPGWWRTAAGRRRRVGGRGGRVRGGPDATTRAGR